MIECDSIPETIRLLKGISSAQICEYGELQDYFKIKTSARQGCIFFSFFLLNIQLYD